MWEAIWGIYSLATKNKMMKKCIIMFWDEVGEFLHTHAKLIIDRSELDIIFILSEHMWQKKYLLLDRHE